MTKTARSNAPLPKGGEDYVVQPNDSLWKIASHLGRQSEFTGRKVSDLIAEIKELNKCRLNGSDNIRAGMTLRMPSGGVQVRAAPNAQTSVVLPQPVRNDEAPLQPAPGAPKTHTVLPNQTFSSIARDFYQDPNKWKLIAAANPKVDPKRLQPGQSLVIPSLAGKPPSEGPSIMERVASLIQGERLDKTAPATQPDSETFAGDALPFTLASEGGISSDRQDPGNRATTMNADGKQTVRYTLTNKGVTQQAFNTYLKGHGQERRSVASITQGELTQLYREQYWNAVRCDRMPKALAVVMFDTSVNMGTGGAIAVLQKTLGLPADGAWGPKTERALQQALGGQLQTAHGTDKFVNSFLDNRMERYRRLIVLSPALGKYKNGWNNRMQDLARHVGSRVTAPPLFAQSGAEPLVYGTADDIASAVAQVQAQAGLAPTGVIDRDMNERLNRVAP